MTFAKWLKQQKHRADPVGDIAKDVIEDCRQCTFGEPNRVGARKGSTFAWWLVHITTVHSACGDAVHALKEAGREYATKFGRGR